MSDPTDPFGPGLADTNDLSADPRPAQEPDNGPNLVPPPPGPQPSGAYEYLVVPRSPPLSPDQPFYKIYGPYQQIETSLAGWGAYADRIDLTDGRRVYRVSLRFMARIPRDAKGAFIGVRPLPVYRFVPEDPTIGQPTLNEWAPFV